MAMVSLYYFKVQAVDNAGNQSSLVTSPSVSCQAADIAYFYYVADTTGNPYYRNWAESSLSTAASTVRVDYEL